jgi:hypothetical protein
MTEPCGHTPAQHEATATAAHDQMRARFTQWVTKEMGAHQENWPLILDLVATRIETPSAGEEDMAPIVALADKLSTDDTYALAFAVGNEVRNAGLDVLYILRTMRAGQQHIVASLIMRVSLPIAMDESDCQVMWRLCDTLSTTERVNLMSPLAIALEHYGFTPEALRAIAPYPAPQSTGG